MTSSPKPYGHAVNHIKLYSGIFTCGDTLRAQVATQYSAIDLFGLIGFSLRNNILNSNRTIMGSVQEAVIEGV